VDHRSIKILSGGGKMKRILAAVGLAAVAALFLGVQGVSADAGKGSTGKQEFEKHCAMCHPEGGNIINAKKTLHGKDLKANNISKPEDIVKVMRNPGPGMTKFDKKTISDKEAMEIAKYILKAFK
jgi:cytochrome c6